MAPRSHKPEREYGTRREDRKPSDAVARWSLREESEEEEEERGKGGGCGCRSPEEP